jgi:hypothetical protein
LSVVRIRAITAKGLSIEQAMLAVEAIEELEAAATAAAAEARRAAKRAGNAERKRLSRLSQRDKRDTGTEAAKPLVSQDEAMSRLSQRDLPVLDKEKSPTPSKEINPTLIGVSSQSSYELFDETLVPEVSGTRVCQKKQQVELFQTVVGLWNDTAAECRLVEVRDITPKRQSAILARSKDLTKTYDFPDVLEGWRALIGRVRGSPFLRGEANGFRCDFDFISRATYFTKIMEGKYETRQEKPKQINFLARR